MDPQLVTELEDIILNSVKVLSPTDFSFQGTVFRASPDKLHTDLAESDHNKQYYYSRLSLRDVLYIVYHCRHTSFIDHKESLSSEHRREDMHEYRDMQTFTAELSRANMGKGTWGGGWEIVRVEKDGQLAVRKEGMILWLDTKYFRSIGEETYKIGTKGQIRMPKEFQQLLPGFYLAFSNTSFVKKNNDIIVKIYWNIRKENASSLVRIVTEELNSKELPFYFKVLRISHHYPRADAAVLYIQKEYFTASKKDISNIYSKVKDFLGLLTPLFAKRLAPGLSLAEESNNGESFGQHRSRILAEAIIKINKEKFYSPQHAMAEISRYFNKNGIDLNHPHTHKNSVDDYDINP